MQKRIITQLTISRLGGIRLEFAEPARQYGMDWHTVKKYYGEYSGKPVHGKDSFSHIYFYTERKPLTSVSAYFCRNLSWAFLFISGCLFCYSPFVSSNVRFAGPQVWIPVVVHLLSVIRLFLLRWNLFVQRLLQHHQNAAFHRCTADLHAAFRRRLSPLSCT